MYKLSIQQGNVITQEMVDRLKPGMTRNQVNSSWASLCWRPLKQDQWVYVYTLEVPDYFIQNFKMVLTFEDDTLATIAGDYVPQDAAAETDAADAGSENAAETDS